MRQYKLDTKPKSGKLALQKLQNKYSTSNIYVTRKIDNFGLHVYDVQCEKPFDYTTDL